MIWGSSPITCGLIVPRGLPGETDLDVCAEVSRLLSRLSPKNFTSHSAISCSSIGSCSFLAGDVTIASYLNLKPNGSAWLLTQGNLYVRFSMQRTTAANSS